MYWLLFEMFDICWSFLWIFALIFLRLLDNYFLFRPSSFAYNARNASRIHLFLWNLLFDRFSINLRYFLFRCILSLWLTRNFLMLFCTYSSTAPKRRFLIAFSMFLLWRNWFLFVYFLFFSLISRNSRLWRVFLLFIFIILFFFAILIKFMLLWITSQSFCILFRWLFDWI